MTENLEDLSLFENATIGDLCSFPCNLDPEVSCCPFLPETICDLCKWLPEESKNITMNKICVVICGLEFPNNPEFCQFCKKFGHLEPSTPTSSSLEVLLDRSEKITLSGEENFLTLS